MIKNIPTASDFFVAGKELLDFSWNIVAQLLKNLDEAEEFDIDRNDISEAYWRSARRSLTTALSITQQGVEFILKGKICEISPYLLLADPPQKWPSLPVDSPIDFSLFRTIDAQDLIRVHDTFSDSYLDPEFVQKFNELREKRNRIMHSVDRSLVIYTKEVVGSLLFMHKALLPDERWAEVRLSFIGTSPDAELGASEYAINSISWEFELVLDLLTPSEVMDFFGIDKKQRRYICPNCYYRANTDIDFERKLALLKPKGPESQTLFCIVCNFTSHVLREDCGSDGCLGNVLSQDGMCLTCSN